MIDDIKKHCCNISCDLDEFMFTQEDKLTKLIKQLEKSNVV